jgi:alkanesulfonate monooxygenase SsuD/methylene tetrahydromethanopterin reductase-like flavin-dependent oxidoreductase (luciferase family)
VNDAKFGWLSPAASHAGSDFKPITIFQAEHLFPSVLPHFDSVWIADHFYGFDDAKKEGFLEAWTTLTWLAAKFDNVDVAHHVVGHGYRNPALIGKMASTLQVLTQGRFILGIGAGWREEEHKAYGYEFPAAAVRLR